jgi:hypothetical protein
MCRHRRQRGMDHSPGKCMARFRNDCKLRSADLLDISIFEGLTGGTWSNSVSLLPMLRLEVWCVESSNLIESSQNVRVQDDGR